VLVRAEHSVAVHVQLAVVRLGQRAERIAVALAGSLDQFDWIHVLHDLVTHVHMDTAEVSNWARWARPVWRVRGVSTIESTRKNTRSERCCLPERSQLSMEAQVQSEARLPARLLPKALESSSPAGYAHRSNRSRGTSPMAAAQPRLRRSTRS